MAFKNLKNHISSLAQPFISGAMANFGQKESAANAGKIAAKLKNKSPFEIDDSPSQQLLANKLSFSPIQYPLDLGSNELGHYMIFYVNVMNATSYSYGEYDGEVKAIQKLETKVFISRL